MTGHNIRVLILFLIVLLMLFAISFNAKAETVGGHHHTIRYAYATQAQTPASGPFAWSQRTIGNAWDSASGTTASVLGEAKRWIGSRNVTGSHRPWCADFANWVLARTGYHTSGSGLAVGMLNAGPHVRTPNLGDLAVMRGHVTIFAGWGGRGFVGVGGNQGRGAGRVTASSYPTGRVIAWVRPVRA